MPASASSIFISRSANPEYNRARTLPCGRTCRASQPRRSISPMRIRRCAIVHASASRSITKVSTLRFHAFDRALARRASSFSAFFARRRAFAAASLSIRSFLRRSISARRANVSLARRARAGLPMGPTYRTNQLSLRRALCSICPTRCWERPMASPIWRSVLRCSRPSP